jgi:hypothetical protein
MANAQFDANVNSMSKLLDLQIKYRDAVLSGMKQAQEILKLEIANSSAMLDLQIKRWKFAQREKQVGLFLRAMKVTDTELQQLAGDFKHLRYCEGLNPALMPAMWRAWRRLSRQINYGWKLERLPSGQTRLEFMEQCQRQLPAKYSDEHLEMIQCMAACDVIIQARIAPLEAKYEKLLKGHLDLWKDA